MGKYSQTNLGDAEEKEGQGLTSQVTYLPSD